MLKQQDPPKLWQIYYQTTRRHLPQDRKRRLTRLETVKWFINQSLLFSQHSFTSSVTYYIQSFNLWRWSVNEDWKKNLKCFSSRFNTLLSEKGGWELNYSGIHYVRRLDIQGVLFVNVGLSRNKHCRTPASSSRVAKHQRCFLFYDKQSGI